VLELLPVPASTMIKSLLCDVVSEQLFELSELDAARHELSTKGALEPLEVVDDVVEVETDEVDDVDDVEEVVEVDVVELVPALSLKSI
jgi:hypothetical protein